MREARRARDHGQGRSAAHLPADRRSAGLRQGRAAICCSATESEILALGRVLTVQALGGTGGLKIGADFLRTVRPGRAGLHQRPELGEPPRAVRERPASRSTPIRTTTPRRTVWTSTRCAPLSTRCPPARSSSCTPAATIPTGVDPTPRNGSRCSPSSARAAGALSRSRVPGLRRRHRRRRGTSCACFPPRRGPLFVSSSFSKSFSLYGERVGALTVVAADKDEAARVLSQIKRLVRTNYSNPPTHGGQIVARCSPTPSCARYGRRSSAACASASRDARVARGEARRPGAGTRFRLHAAPARNVLVLRDSTKAQVAAAARRFSIYAIDTGPHLRRRAELQEHRLRRRRDRVGARYRQGVIDPVSSGSARAERFTADGIIIDLRGNSSVGRAQPCQG